MTDFETHPIGTADCLKLLEAVYEAADVVLHSDVIGSNPENVEQLAVAVNAVQTGREPFGEMFYSDGKDLLVESSGLRLEQIEIEATKIVQLLRDVGTSTKWADRNQTDRVFAWYEFDDLRIALGEMEEMENE